MQRWNGWGNISVQTKIPVRAVAILEAAVGKSEARGDFPLDDILLRVPVSRLPSHSLISTDPRERIVHAHGQGFDDWVALRMGMFERFPDGVAHPCNMAELEEILQLADANKIVIIPFGGGTSVSGQVRSLSSERPLLVLSMRNMNRVLDIDQRNGLAVIEAGATGPELEAGLRMKGYTLGHFPRSFEFSTLGGWIMTASSGTLASHYGTISHLFVDGEILIPAGTLRLNPGKGQGPGPELKSLCVGAEGRFGVLSRAAMRISPIPESDTITGVVFPSWEDGVEAVRSVALSGIPFSMIQLSSPAETRFHLAMSARDKEADTFMETMKKKGIDWDKACFCLAGFVGTESVTSVSMKECFSIFMQRKGVLVGRTSGAAWRRNLYRRAYAKNALWEMGYGMDTLEISATWEKVNTLVHAIARALSRSASVETEKVHVYCHLSGISANGATVSTTFIFRLPDTPEKAMSFRGALFSAACRSAEEEGCFPSGRHGIGIEHVVRAEDYFGKIGFGMLKQMVNSIDPEKRMNPGKTVP